MLIGHTARLRRTERAVRELMLPPAVWKSCPWEPRDLVEEGLRQWLRCAGAALADGQVIGMPSRAVDEAWHGLILCTARYARFCDDAYGEFLHHHPEGDAIPGEHPPAAGRRRGRRKPTLPGSMADQLARTVAAWEIVRAPGEGCVLWDLDERVGVQEPWGLDDATLSRVLVALHGPPER